MNDNNISGAQSLDSAEQLLEFIEPGNGISVLDTQEHPSEIRESQLFQELGDLTQDFYDTLISFQLGSKRSVMTVNDVPDTKKRLTHVISKTQEAAKKNLGVVEISLPITEELQLKAARFSERWDRFGKWNMNIAEFSELSKKMDAFAEVGLADRILALQELCSSRVDVV